MKLLRRRICPVALTLIVSLCFLAGCEGLTYLLHAAEGQLRIQGETEPIEDVLASGRLSEQEDATLRLIVKAREYAVDEIGLVAGNSYTTFYDSAGDPVVFSLSAVRRDALEPKKWAFPIFGEAEHLLFFDEQYLRRVEQELIDAGLDTYTYEADAYSTLGFFEDPVRSPMLRRNALSAAETIFHELLHNTIWRPSAEVFNESLAVFVSRTAAVEFLRAELGDDSGWPEFAAVYYADVDAVSSFLFELYEELEAYYARPLSAEEKIAGRETVYQAQRDRFVNEVQPTLTHPEWFEGYANLPTNNAWVRVRYRYNLDLATFEAVYEALGEDWSAALNVFRAAASALGDPFEYLRNWLAERID
ncbi:MAG: aminopeptidase [Phycisphaerae bacterium]